MSTSADEWYLSFDCATKSFAFSVLRLRPPPPDLPETIEKLSEAIRAKNWKVIDRLVREIDTTTRECFFLAGGGAADLVPGKADKEIPTVERIRAVKSYIEGPVAAVLEAAEGCPPPDSPHLNVAVEFQMGPNAPARTVATVLLSHYSRANIFLVGPAYKNKMWYPSRPDLRHCFYVERYSKLYDANKAHARDLYFKHIAPIFGHNTGRIPVKYQKDFADTVIQILGFLAYGDIENAAEKF